MVHSRAGACSEIKRKGEITTEARRRGEERKKKRVYREGAKDAKVLW